MATVWCEPVWASGDADVSWGFRGIPMFARAGKANFAAGDVIHVTRYRRVPSRPNISQWRAFPPLHGKLHPLGGTRRHRGWSRGTLLGPPEIGPGAGCGPLGAKPTTFHPETNAG
jgi:hypothetical protein